MKKLLWIFLLICITINSQAQLLWKISGNGLQQPSYLFSTHHIAPLSIIDSIAGFQAAFDESTQIIGEMVISEAQTPEAIQLMQQMMIMPGDTTLHTLFTEDELNRVSEATKEYLESDLTYLLKVKPAFISNNIVVMMYIKHHPEYKSQEQMDSHFQVKALEEAKKVIGLETMEFQCELLFNSSPLQRQAEVLICTLSDIDKTMEAMNELTYAYMNQDMDDILQVIQKREGTHCDPLPGEMEAMLDNRNLEWIKILVPLLQEETNFIVVGAGHLPGKKGLISLLKKNGYQVDAIH